MDISCGCCLSVRGEFAEVVYPSVFLVCNLLSLSPSILPSFLSSSLCSSIFPSSLHHSIPPLSPPTSHFPFLLLCSLFPLPASHAPSPTPPPSLAPWLAPLPPMHKCKSASTMLAGLLYVHWRGLISQFLHTRYFTGTNYYHLNLIDLKIDNP